jgi:hypothetical protein
VLRQPSSSLLLLLRPQTPLLRSCCLVHLLLLVVVRWHVTPHAPITPHRRLPPASLHLPLLLLKCQGLPAAVSPSVLLLLLLVRVPLLLVLL